MEKIDNIIDFLEGTENKIPSYLAKAIAKRQNIIIDLNIQQHTEFGELSTGEPIEPEYSPYTIEIKQQKNQISDFVTLEDYGEWHGGFYLIIDDEGFEIDSKDWKTGNLYYKYGPDIFGLTPENLEELNLYLIDDLIDEIRNELWN